jgi:hypothetical protein
VAAVKVLGWWPIEIHRLPDGAMRYSHNMENIKPLWESEGFATREGMGDWFRPS